MVDPGRFLTELWVIIGTLALPEKQREETEDRGERRGVKEVREDRRVGVAVRGARTEEEEEGRREGKERENKRERRKEDMKEEKEKRKNQEKKRKEKGRRDWMK